MYVVYLSTAHAFFEMAASPLARVFGGSDGLAGVGVYVEVEVNECKWRVCMCVCFVWYIHV